MSGSLFGGTDNKNLLPWTFRPIHYFRWILSWGNSGMDTLIDASWTVTCFSRTHMQSVVSHSHSNAAVHCVWPSSLMQSTKSLES